MQRLILLAALTACACGPSSYDDFRVQLAKRACDRQVRCGQIGASQRQQCAAPTELLITSIEEPDVAVQNRRMRYFSDAARDCLEAVGGAPCDDVALAYRVQQRCHHVLEPGAQPGEACFSGECEGGVCAGAAPSCMGSCASFPPPGAACVANDPSACDPTVQYCDGACQRKRPAGARCDADAQCVYGFFCVAGACGDPPVFHAGDACPVIGRLCSDELYCASTNLCAAFVDAAGSCDADAACKPGLACVGLVRSSPGSAPSSSGTCQAWADATQPCAAASVSGCPATLECQGGACQPVATSARLTVGERCAADGACQAGLYCGASACSYQVGAGGDCSLSPGACLPGLSCDGQTHVCATNTACGL